MLCVDALDVVYGVPNDGVEGTEDSEGHGGGRRVVSVRSKYITTQIMACQMATNSGRPSATLPPACIPCLLWNVNFLLSYTRSQINSSILHNVFIASPQASSNRINSHV